MAMQALHEWFETPLGRYLLEREQAYFDDAVADVFGFNAMQFGLEGHDFLRTNRIPLRFNVGRENGAAVRGDFSHLPIESSSIDLAVLPHVLEFSEHPHDILREVQRALLPEGQLIISGFNPRSLWGLWRLAYGDRRECPWCGNFISLPRLKDWLALLDLEVTGGHVGCYAPPVRQEKWLQRYRFMEAAGGRWWPISGGVYYLRAVKRVHGMRVIKPNWYDRQAAREGLASVAQRLRGSGSGTGGMAARAPGEQHGMHGPALVLPFPPTTHARRGPDSRGPEGKREQ
jgi:SAM-dependent methyltransferase